MKKFKKVKVGDIGFNYRNDQVEVLTKYSKKEIDESILFVYQIDDKDLLNRNCVVVKDIVHGDIDFYVYGDDGVYVPKNSEVSKFILEENEAVFLVESIQFILDNCENSTIKKYSGDYTFNNDQVEDLKVRLMEFADMYEED